MVNVREVLRTHPHIIGAILTAFFIVIVWIVYMLWVSKNG